MTRGPDLGWAEHSSAHKPAVCPKEVVGLIPLPGPETQGSEASVGELLEEVNDLDDSESEGGPGTVVMGYLSISVHLKGLYTAPANDQVLVH